MPSPNFPDRDKIPDMSLDDAIQAPGPAPAPVPPASYQAEVPPSAPPAANAAGSPRIEDEAGDWREGDAVLAPWEPFYLYPGVIREILIDEGRGDQALIDFDDGGQGWVFLDSVEEFEFQVGEQVENRRLPDNQYRPAKIIDIEGDQMHLRYLDGRLEWADTSSLRVRCIENGPGATATRIAHWQTPEPMPATTGGGVPSWLIWVGIGIAVTFMRMACQ